MDSRLLERFSQQELTNLKDNNPEKLAMYNYALDNGCYTAEMPTGKSITLEEISIDAMKELNFISLGLNIEKQNQYFKIAGQDKMLVVKSEWVLNHELNN
jgi:hypothetical protein